jgi:tetratricopeptide (TPR) repeat protein
LSPDDPTAFDEDYVTWMAALDDALAGRSPAGSPKGDIPDRLRPQLDRDLAWLSLLRQHWPGRSPTDTSASTNVEGILSNPLVLAAGVDPATAPVRLGRFEVRRELGRGAFGRVFLAYDPELRREVALKVPRPEILPISELRGRFQREARAAAGLDHPNVVPVYETGEVGPICYIASAYCPGVTLAAWLRERTESVPAELAARLMVPLAEAVAHAHSRGVLHRDLKPSNVLLEASAGPGTEGLEFVPRVTDFGLAKLSAEETLNLTQSGVVLGTPSYMAPEQAGSKSKDISPATDVYALGAILYELLTGRPPFVAESMLDMLEQVRSREPTSPRRLRPQIPRDLETICLKCLQKEPGNRYVSARQLADDLRRFVEDRPIRARRPTLAQHLRRWLRRYTLAIVTGLVAAALLLLSAVVFLLVSNAAIDRARKEAMQQRDDAQTQRQLARRAVDKMYIQVAERWLAGQPRLEPEQREFLEEALHFYQGFAQEQNTDPELRLEAGNAFRRLGEIQEKLGDTTKATEAYNRASALLEQLVADFRHESRYRAALAHSLASLGGLLARLDRRKEAEKQIQKALLLREELVKESPEVVDHQRELAYVHADLANAQLAQGRAREAAETQGRAIFLLRTLPAEQANTLECRFRQACCLRDQGWALAIDGRLAEAVESGREALALLEKLSGDWPKDANIRRELAWTLKWLGCYLPEARSHEAEAVFRRAIDIYDRLMLDFPAVAVYKRQAALSRKDLGERLKVWYRLQDAEEMFREALHLYEQLVAEIEPAPHIYWRELVETRHQLERLLGEMGRLMEAAEGRRKSLAIAEKLVKDFPSIHRFRYLVALNYQRLGEVLQEAGQLQVAESAYRKALVIASELAEAFPTPEFLEADYGRFLADCQNGLADLFVTSPALSRDPAQAVSLAQKAVKLRPGQGAFWWTLGVAYYRAGDWNASVTALEQADQLHNSGEIANWFFLAMAHWQLGHQAAARQFYGQATASMKANKQILDKYKLMNARFCRFRAEAAALLAVREPLDPAERTSGSPPH